MTITDDLMASQQQYSQNIMAMPSASVQSYNSPYIQKHIPNLIKWEVDIKDVVIDVRNDMIGKEFQITESGFPELVQASEPLMNEVGATRVLGFTKFDFSKGVVLSNFEKEEINLAVEEYESILSFILHMKNDNFGLDPAYIMSLRAQMGRAVMSTYNRALNGRTASLLRETQSHSEVVTNAPQGRKGILRGMFGGGLR